MNITLEKNDELNAVLKVEVAAEDYQTKVEKNLKDHQKKMNMPGFRPGKVPFTVVNKMYGKAVLLDEINKLVIDSMYDYIGQNKIDILGNPLPNREKSTEIDWDNQKNFEFFYDLGICPNIEIEPLEKLEVKYYDITVNDKVAEKYLDDIRRRYGKYSNPEETADGDLIYCEFTELDENKEPKEGGVTNKASLALDMIKNKTSKKKFIGLKKDETVDVDLVKILDNNREVSLILGIDEAKVAELGKLFRVKALAISRVELAPVDKELFEKVYKADNIESEEQLKERIKKDAQLSFVSESDRNFVNNIVELLLEKTKVILPDTFLKRWMLETNKEETTEEQIEKEYSVYADSLKWQLIENKILKDNNIEVGRNDIKEYVKNYFRTSMPAGVDSNMMPEDKLDEIAERLLQNKEETKRIYDKLYDDKIKDLFKSKVKQKREEISYEEFVKVAAPKHDHHDHDHDHEH